MGSPTDINTVLETAGIGGQAIRYDLAHPDLFDTPADIVAHEASVQAEISYPNPASDASAEGEDTSGTAALGEYAPADKTFDHAALLETSGTLGNEPVEASVLGDDLSAPEVEPVAAEDETPAEDVSDPAEDDEPVVEDEAPAVEPVVVPVQADTPGLADADVADEPKADDNA